MTEQEVPAYTSGETVRLPLELKDSSGIGYCFANFYPADYLDNPVPDIEDFPMPLELEGDGEGLKEGVVTLTATLAGENPGVYRCETIIVRDTVGNQTQISEFPERLSLRIVENPNADYDGPELVGIQPLTR